MNEEWSIQGVKYVCNHRDYQASQKGLPHIQSKHPGVIFACEKCQYKSTDKHCLKIHVQSIHEGNQYDRKFATQSSMRKHILSLHEGMKYECN